MLEYYCYQQYGPYSRVPVSDSYIRVLHASPNAPAVDVYANGNLIARALPYRGFTPYLKIAPGNYNISVFAAGQTQNPVLSTELNIPPQSIYTVAAIGKLPGISLLPVHDAPMDKNPSKVYLRFVHLSPDAPNVDLTLADGKILFKNIGYKGITDYTILDHGTYIFELRLPGTEKVVLYVPNIKLLPNRYYTIYVVGLASGQPSLQMLIPLDGNSYIKF